MLCFSGSFGSVFNRYVEQTLACFAWPPLYSECNWINIKCLTLDLALEDVNILKFKLEGHFNCQSTKYRILPVDKQQF